MLPKEIGGPLVSIADKYLNDRGIGPEIRNKYDLAIVSGQRVAEDLKLDLYLNDHVAIKLPYYNADGELTSYRAYRMIKVHLHPVRTFGGVETGSSISKMLCSAKARIRACLCPFNDWHSPMSHTKVYFCESVLKSIVVNELVGHAIGLNGVACFSSAKHGYPELLPELADLPWSECELEPIVIFDSDVETNPQVRKHIARLAAALKANFGVETSMLELKSPTKIGIDDFYHQNGPEITRQFLEGEGVPAELDPLTRAIYDLNEEVCVVRAGSRIFEFSSKNDMTREQFTKVNYADRIIPNPNNKPPMISVPELWLRHKDRRIVNAIGYKPLLIETFEEDGQLKANTFKGLSVKPRENSGALKMWTDVLENAIPNEDYREWILDRWAYQIQNPEVRQPTIIYFYGPQGTGKNSIVEPLLQIYGMEGVTIGQEELNDRWNDCYVEKLFVVFDEAHGTDRVVMRSTLQKLKMLASAPNLQRRQRNHDNRTVHNYTNVVILGNEPDAIMLEEGEERRFAVFGLSDDGDLRHDEAYWMEYYARMGEISRAVLWLLQERDIRAFNPNAWAPETEYKEVVRETTRNIYDQMVADLEMKLIGQWADLDCFTPEQLWLLCFGTQEYDVSKSKQLGVALRRKYKKAYGGKPILVGQKQFNFWHIQNPDHNYNDAESVRRHVQEWQKKWPQSGASKF